MGQDWLKGTRLLPNDMEDTNRQKSPGRPRGSGKGGTELRVGEIKYKPGPDADDRLRRLFTKLLNLAKDEAPVPGNASSRVRFAASRALRMGPDSPDPVTFEVLQAEWTRVLGRLPNHLGLRLHRALSWIGRAKKEPNDPDAAFIFYWIAFNAVYVQENSRTFESTECSPFADFFDTLLHLDSANVIHTAIWHRFSNPIRVLLDNKLVFQLFWNHHAGRDHENWKHAFESNKRKVRQALADHDTKVILNTLFDRLYVLFNQLIHGRATWRGSVNRDQVRDGARILSFLVAIFVELMMSEPDINWGLPDCPDVS